MLALRTDASGDFATYTLRLVESPGALTPPDGIDQVLSQVDFSFKVECPTDFDCAPAPRLSRRPARAAAPQLPRQGLRQLPPPDARPHGADSCPTGASAAPPTSAITLVEILAYTADRLSYAQDAVATEAYLATARRRSSVRRHARLVDYRMHDGANARVWVQLETAADDVGRAPRGTAGS